MVAYNAAFQQATFTSLNVPFIHTPVKFAIDSRHHGEIVSNQ